MYIPLDRTKYFGERLFGDDVEVRFPSTSFDIDEAGKCVIAGRWTAAVFHMMRVMELGVQELATVLSVPVPSDKHWGALHTAISKQIMAMPNGTQAEQQKKSSFNDEATYLGNVKNSWRNPTMHPGEKYTQEETMHIFECVKKYMQNLAKII
jgi:HEPN domain-containing protein